MNRIENIRIRRADERGRADHGWLDARFTFSFGDYYDPDHMSFRSMRVMNNDRIQPDNGFGMHPHQDMEIFTYVIEGELAHKDSMGNGSVIHAGDVQKITAGKGIRHSEYNPSKDQTTYLYQIWIMPNQKGLEPSYQELSLKDIKRENALTLIASNAENDKVIHVNQDVKIYFGQLNAETSIEHITSNERGVWVQVIKGQLEVEGETLSAGDGISMVNVEKINLKNISESQFLLFDLI